MRKFIGMGLLCFSLAGCSNAGYSSQNYNLAGIDGNPVVATNVPVAPIKANNELASPAEQKRIVLTNVTLSGIVENPADVITQFNKLAVDFGGWVVNSSTSGNQTQASGAITMRIPAEKVQDALARIRAALQSVTSENNTGQDVTQDYVDTTSQIANLEAAEASLKKILDEAKNTEDVLKVFNQLTTIRGQIETAKGKIKFWNEASAYASITVNVAQKYVAPASTSPGWAAENTLNRAFTALIAAVQGLFDILIWVVVFGLPFAIPAGITWIIWQKVRRRLKART